MCAIVEGRDAVVLPVGMSLFEVLLPARIQSSDGLKYRSSTVQFQSDIEQHAFDNEYLGQVSVVAGQTEIQLGGIVVCQNPWENRILAQVVICPSCS